MDASNRSTAFELITTPRPENTAQCEMGRFGGVDRRQRTSPWRRRVKAAKDATLYRQLAKQIPPEEPLPEFNTPWEMFSPEPQDFKMKPSQLVDFRSPTPLVSSSSGSSMRASSPSEGLSSGSISSAGRSSPPAIVEGFPPPDDSFEALHDAAAAWMSTVEWIEEEQTLESPSDADRARGVAAAIVDLNMDPVTIPSPNTALNMEARQNSNAKSGQFWRKVLSLLTLVLVLLGSTTILHHRDAPHSWISQSFFGKLMAKNVPPPIPAALPMPRAPTMEAAPHPEAAPKLEAPSKPVKKSAPESSAAKVAAKVVKVATTPRPTVKRPAGKRIKRAKGAKATKPKPNAKVAAASKPEHAAPTPVAELQTTKVEITAVVEAPAAVAEAPAAVVEAPAAVVEAPAAVAEAPAAVAEAPAAVAEAPAVTKLTTLAKPAMVFTPASAKMKPATMPIADAKAIIKEIVKPAPPVAEEAPAAVEPVAAAEPVAAPLSFNNSTPAAVTRPVQSIDAQSRARMIRRQQRRRVTGRKHSGAARSRASKSAFTIDRAIRGLGKTMRSLGESTRRFVKESAVEGGMIYTQKVWSFLQQPAMAGTPRPAGENPFTVAMF